MVFWLFVACVLGIGGGLALSGAVAFLRPGSRDHRQMATRIVRWLPAMGFAYLLGCIVLFAAWSGARGRDWGWGSTWVTPVLGNYSLVMLDTTEHATLYDRTDAGTSGDGPFSTSARRDVILGVRRLEVRPPYLIGAASPVSLSGDALPGAENRFFILDTRSGSRVDEASLPALQAAAQKLGGPLKMEPVKAVYGHSRYDKADLIPLVAFLIPPVFGTWLLMRWFRSGRADHGSADQDGDVSPYSMPQQNSTPTGGLFLCSAHGVIRSSQGSYSRSHR